MVRENEAKREVDRDRESKRNKGGKQETRKEKKK